MIRFELEHGMKKDVVNGVYQYCRAIKGMGKMTGKEFADNCRRVWSEDNKANAYYYALFEQYIISINVEYGVVRCVFDNEKLLNFDKDAVKGN